ncbi:hypothetical protein E1A91_D09G113300v1 [Gossypium mustelinum]|uniref:Uncharacterized protein n=1 Tax=Gossypium mustelinum TaxID=34275 RepID=A0A5D2TJ91_GOSMU|nr:hypothetical protein E1A91_D09G113300v1 [Gossypium mustelinum]
MCSLGHFNMGIRVGVIHGSDPELVCCKSARAFHFLRSRTMNTIKLFFVVYLGFFIYLLFAYLFGARWSIYTELKFTATGYVRNARTCMRECELRRGK